MIKSKKVISLKSVKAHFDVTKLIEESLAEDWLRI